MQKIHIVSHTHWDREWYEPFQVFRMRLVRCIDNLLDLLARDPSYKHFLLDGQTIVLEDYAQVRPDRAEGLRTLVRAGRLDIGPWYVLPDEFLVSGESIIRNLMYGMRLAREFGGTMRIGYIPDPFGHISQMPQILRGFGIGSAVFRRGLSDEPTELWWQASDGTRVLACYLRDGYDNAARLPHDDAGFTQGLERIRDSLGAYAVTNNLLAMNGTDHMEPWADLTHLLIAAQAKLADAEIIHSSLPGYVSQVEREIESKPDLCVAEGELRSPKRHHLLPGVASARMWIKQRNARAQMLLEKYAEPTTALAFHSGLLPGMDSTQGLLRLAWKYLLQNHPHDSICGCGVDATHSDMGPRFDWVEQIAEGVTHGNLEALAGAIDTRQHQAAGAVLVFNPGTGPRSDRVNVTIEAPGRMEQFILLDEQGNEVPYQVCERHVREYYRTEIDSSLLKSLLGMATSGAINGLVFQDAFLRTDKKPVFLDITMAEQGEPNLKLLHEGIAQIEDIIEHDENAAFELRVHSPTRYKIEFMAPELPAFGFKTYFIRPESDPPEVAVEHPPLIENEFYRVEPNPMNGTLTIADKTTGVVYAGLNRFTDGGDRGDLYNYCPPAVDTILSAPSVTPEIKTEATAIKQTLVIGMTYRLPAQLTDDRNCRSPETVDECVETAVSLYPGVRRIDFRVAVENRARDHRLRVEFSTPIRTGHASAKQSFDVVDRPLALPSDTDEWIERPRPEAPMQEFVSVSNGKLGLTLAARGLPEYAATRQEPEEGTTLALTLLRSVGWLSRGDLTTRMANAGPELETPGAQEIGSHVFEYTLIPHAGDWQHAFSEAIASAVPLQTVTTGEHPGKLPPSMSFISSSPEEFVVSAVKLAEKGEGLIVRGYNIGAKPIEVRLSLWREFKHVTAVGLNEEFARAGANRATLAGHHVTVSVRPKEIVTLRLE